jgi:hypothetical protein
MASQLFLLLFPFLNVAFENENNGADGDSSGDDGDRL